MFFESWDNLGRVLAVGVLAYIGLILLLRLSGNRTLSKMNSFDLVVTVAFGSTLSSLLISKDVTLAQGLVAIALLVFLQYAITWLSVRSGFISQAVKTRPTLIVRDGRFLPAAMKKVRVTEDEVRGALREKGLGGMEQVAAVVLDTDGKLSVISMAKRGSLDALQGVACIDEE